MGKKLFLVIVYNTVALCVFTSNFLWPLGNFFFSKHKPLKFEEILYATISYTFQKAVFFPLYIPTSFSVIISGVSFDAYRLNLRRLAGVVLMSLNWFVSESTR